MYKFKIDSPQLATQRYQELVRQNIISEKVVEALLSVPEYGFFSEITAKQSVIQFLRRKSIYDALINKKLSTEDFLQAVKNYLSCANDRHRKVNSEIAVIDNLEKKVIDSPEYIERSDTLDAGKQRYQQLTQQNIISQEAVGALPSVPEYGFFSEITAEQSVIQFLRRKSIYDVLINQQLSVKDFLQAVKMYLLCASNKHRKVGSEEREIDALAEKIRASSSNGALKKSQS